MHAVSCINTHDVADIVNHEMGKIQNSNTLRKKQFFYKIKNS